MLPCPCHACDTQRLANDPQARRRGRSKACQGVIATFSTSSRWLANRSYADSMSASL